jgi:hypothetical protein
VPKRRAPLDIAALSGSLSRTPLGGYRWHPYSSTLFIDFWELQHSVLFAEHDIPHTIENLLDGFPLNVERAAFNIRDQTLIERGAVRAISSNIIEHNPRWVQTAWLHINAARAVSIAQHTGLTLGQSVINLIRQVDWSIHSDAAREFFRANGHSDAHAREILATVKQLAHGGNNVFPT